MDKNRKRQDPAPKIVLQDDTCTLKLAEDEYELLLDILKYMDHVDEDAFIAFANEERRTLYGEDWEPCMELTKEKLDKALDALTSKWSDAGWRGRSDKN